MTHKLECIDIGSKYCPCYLAYTNECIVCSILQEKKLCECNWQGVCVYQEYKSNGCKKKDERKTSYATIESIENISEDCVILKLKVDKDIAEQLIEPGAYIFIRNNNLPHYFDTPMSIMDVDVTYGYIYVAYQVLGVKTKELESNKDLFTIRGPYWNGLYGMKSLKKVSGEKCLVIARGIAQAPALLVIKKLVENKNDVTFIIDKANTGSSFIKKYLKGLDVKVLEEDVRSEDGRNLIEDNIRNNDIKLIYCGGSDLLHKSIIKTVDKTGKDPYLVITNNNEICCGEGICGGCIIRLSDGTRVKTCKTQLDPRVLIERRVNND